MNPQKITPNTVIQRVDAALTSRLGEEAVVMNVNDTTYHKLNVTGSRLWALLAEPITISQLCDAFTAEFSVSQDQCMGDIQGFVENALTQGLVEIVEASEG